VQVRTFGEDESAGDVQEIRSEAVVAAVPTYAMEQLLTTLPERGTPNGVYDAMRELQRIPYADVAVLTFAFPLDAMPEAPGSGFLVPSIEHRFIKAATFSSNKWEWTGDAAAAQGLFVLRASVGRYGESIEELLDVDLIERAWADLRDLLPGLPAPEHARIDRWQQSLPQYLVGHLARVDRIRTGLAALPGLAVAGAAYDGIGIAACVASGRSAARSLLAR
jgi:oxygen-dependent protoporphyrinogen oxidase